jgi:hypothetical protein
MKNQEKKVNEITSGMKENIDRYILTSERQMKIQEAMIDTLEQMLVLEKKESAQWRILCFILLIAMIICSVSLLTT